MYAPHREYALSDLFVAYLLARNIRYEEDLIDQLLTSNEKRLAPGSAYARALRQRGCSRDSSSQKGRKLWQT